MSRARHNPTRQIELRQRQEDTVSTYRGIAAEHTKLKMLGQWEEKTHNRIEANDLFRRMDEVQARHDDVLVERRKHLAELLLKEREEHEHMIANLAESDEQRRERLMQNARDLRNQREQIRQEQSQIRKDQLFREESVLVREAESRLKVLAVAAQRKQQIEENQQRRVQSKDEEQFFAEQFLDEQRRQAARTQSDLEDIHRRRVGMRHDLSVQVQANQQRRVEEKELQRKDDDAFREDVQRGLAAEAQAEQDRRDRQKALAEEVKRHNAEQRFVKDAELEKLKTEDKKELEDLLRRIAEDEAAEAKRKREAREDARYQIKFVEAQMNAVAESETALDKLWQEENDKEWAKRESRWTTENTRRENLLRDVFQSRKEQVTELRERERLEAQRKYNEHEQMIKDIERMTTQDTGELMKKRETAKQTQSYLASQVAKRQAEKQSIRDGKKVEMTDAQAAEHQYREKINFELSKLEASKPEEYRGVKLGGKKRGLSGLE